MMIAKTSLALMLALTCLLGCAHESQPPQPAHKLSSADQQPEVKGGTEIRTDSEITTDQNQRANSIDLAQVNSYHPDGDSAPILVPPPAVAGVIDRSPSSTHDVRSCTEIGCEFGFCKFTADVERIASACSDASDVCVAQACEGGVSCRMLSGFVKQAEVCSKTRSKLKDRL
jgi:hypothetical protein